MTAFLFGLAIGCVAGPFVLGGLKLAYRKAFNKELTQ